MSSLKKEFLALLKEDEEFRYAVAGLLGLEEILRRLDRHEEELAKLREDMNKLREDMIAGFRRHDEELAKLREDMNKGFGLMQRHIDALGARWGLMSEEAFRNGLRGILERELGFKVERWSHYDGDGLVYGYPSIVEVDVVIRDERLMLIEISSNVRSSDVYEFKRKAELYEKVTKRKPDRLMIVSPYIDEAALEACRNLGVEPYTKV